MKKIKILWVGKTKEPYLNEGISRYLRLMSPMARVSVVEINGCRGKKPEEAVIREGSKILKQTGSFALLDEKGKGLTSFEFADFIKGRECVDFVLGGPFGVSDEIKLKASDTIALSKMTFTHEMARLVFLEQLYRAMTIIKGKEYHH
jgi:23S rRNA (pseudouridine1915-N3)-methyltransferase